MRSVLWRTDRPVTPLEADLARRVEEAFDTFVPFPAGWEPASRREARRLARGCVCSHSRLAHATPTGCGCCGCGRFVRSLIGWAVVGMLAFCAGFWAAVIWAVVR